MNKQVVTLDFTDQINSMGAEIQFMCTQSEPESATLNCERSPLPPSEGKREGITQGTAEFRLASKRAPLTEGCLGDVSSERISHWPASAHSQANPGIPNRVGIVGALPHWLLTQVHLMPLGLFCWKYWQVNQALPLYH